LLDEWLRELEAMCFCGARECWTGEARWTVLELLLATCFGGLPWLLLATDLDALLWLLLATCFEGLLWWTAATFRELLP
jgi:hypothetical protein